MDFDLVIREHPTWAVVCAFAVPILLTAGWIWFTVKKFNFYYLLPMFTTVFTAIGIVVVSPMVVIYSSGLGAYMEEGSVDRPATAAALVQAADEAYGVELSMDTAGAFVAGIDTARIREGEMYSVGAITIATGVELETMGVELVWRGTEWVLVSEGEILQPTEEAWQ